MLPTLVNLSQAVFVQGRSLIQNILMCHDMMRHYNRKTSARCLMKIDLRKTYDMVRWEFVEKMMHGYRFPLKFINLIMTCVSTITFTIKVNGEGCGFFPGKRGLRQGDPISPLLFVLVMEYFTRVMSRMNKFSDFRYHPMCKGQQIIHLTFADDLIIFCKGTETLVQRIMKAIKHFTATTGLAANADKSNIFLAGVNQRMQDRLLETTRFKSGVLPIRYLGLTLSHKKWTKLDHQ